MDLLILLSLVLIYLPDVVWSHARLMSPPARSSMWRFGFPTPINFNDNQLYCGGLTIQKKNGGKCGICGDAYNLPHPRPNEAGGKFGLGIISKRYVSGQVIDATVDVTTNHRGYFEFKLCPNNNPKKEATQECLDKHVLKQAYGTGTRYYIEDKRKGEITLQLQLPKDLICSQCVFQWTYVAGNNWGKCPDGNSGLGCGPQETFRGCADIAIHKDGDVFDVKPNEIDVESKNHEIPDYKNKNEIDDKGLTNGKFITYSYEVSKQTRQNSSDSNFVRIHNYSHHDVHKDSHPTKNDIKDKPFSTTKKEQNSSERRSPSSTSRQRYKYHNRNFYHLKNINPSTNKNPFDQNWDFLMNNNRFPMSFGQIKIEKGKNQFSKKYDRQSSRFTNPDTYLKVIKLPLIISDSEEDTSAVSEGFSLGGRRYKDFWLL